MPPRHNWKLALLIGSFALLAVVYSAVVPAFETPDEIWHFAFVQHLATGQGLPVSEPNTLALMRQQSVQPPAYYLVAAALTVWIDQHDFPEIYARANPHRAIGRADTGGNINYLIHHADETWPGSGSILALHLARLLSVVLGCLTLWGTYRILALLLDETLALLGTAVVAFIPQFVFISASASNDNAVNALATLVLWRVVVLLARPPADVGQTARSWWRPSGLFILLGSLLGLAVLSKLSALALLVIVGLAVLATAWRAQRWQVLLHAALWIGLPVLVIGGWWYLRNWQLYGDPLAWNMWQANILLRVVPATWQTIAGELGSLEQSFWGLFGWLNVPFPPWMYTLLRGLALVLLAGLCVAAGRAWRSHVRPNWRWLAGGLLVLWLGLLLVSWLNFMRSAPAAQGRYFFPALATIALLAALGLRGWRPPHGVSWLNGVMVGGLVSLSLLTPWLVIRPAYQPPPAATASDLRPVHITFGDQFALHAVAAAPDQVTPGATAHVTVTWQALQPGPADYSVFVQLIDDDGLVVAQADTMPGGGLLPTSQWQRGQQRSESYPVRIPNLAYTPNHAQWAVGLYDARLGQRLPISDSILPPDMVIMDDALRFGIMTVQPQPGQVPNPIAADFEDNLTLAGYSLSARRLEPGQPVTVTLYWEARGPVAHDYTTFAHLLDRDFQTRGGHDAAPVLPTSAWTPGTIITDTHVFVVDPAAPTGLYQIEVGLYPWPAFDRLPLVETAGAEGADRILLGPVAVQ